MKKLKAVLIGAGRMGRNHLRVLQEDKRYELVAVIDPVFHSNDSSLKIFKDYKDINQMKEWDVVFIAAPTQLHFEMVDFLIEYKKPILVEKPLASSPDQAKLLLEKAKKYSTLLAVGHLERFNPAVIKVKEVIEAGWIGTPLHLSFTRVGGYPGSVMPGNNVLLDLAVHDIDVMNFLVGKPEYLSSITHRAWNKGIEDTAEVLLRSESGVSASLHVNWVTPTKIRTLRVTGTKGVLFADYILQTVQMYGGNLLQAETKANYDYNKLIDLYKSTDKVEFGIEKQEPLRVQLTEFYHKVLGEPSKVCSSEDAELAVRLAYQSFEKANKGILS